MLGMHGMLGILGILAWYDWMLDMLGKDQVCLIREILKQIIPKIFRGKWLNLILQADFSKTHSQCFTALPGTLGLFKKNITIS